MVKLFYQISGAYIVTNAAVLTLTVIDAGKIVLYMYRSVGALLFADLASYAAGFAEFAGNCAFLNIMAGNSEAGGIGNHYDHILGAGVFARLTALAGIAVYYGNAIDYMDSIEFTDLDTVAVPEAAVYAIVHTIAERGVVGGAVINTNIIVFGGCSIAARAAHKCYHRLGSGCLYTHNCRYFLGGISAAGGAFVAGSAAFNDCFRIIGAACKAAAAAVGARKRVHYSFLTGIGLDCENFGSISEDKTEERAEDGKDTHGKCNSYHIAALLISSGRRSP